MSTVRSIAVAAIALVVIVALGDGAASLMEGSSPEDDACIGCGLVLLGSIAVGLAAAVVIVLVSWVRRRDHSRPTA